MKHKYVMPLMTSQFYDNVSQFYGFTVYDRLSPWFPT